jgi:hypothetical protein
VPGGEDGIQPLYAPYAGTREPRDGFFHAGEPLFEGGDLLSSLLPAVEGFTDRHGVVDDFAQGGGVQGEDADLVLQTRRRFLDQVRRDGADIAEALGDDQVGCELVEELRVEGVDAAAVGEKPADGRVYLGAGHVVPFHLAAREVGQFLDAGRVIALVGHADEGVSRAAEVDHLGRAREERGYAHRSS